VNASGTVVAFTSTNRNLAPEAFPVPGDTWQQYDVYVRDTSDPNPLNHVTERITTGIGGVKADGSSIEPIVSPDGRYVWFSSAASNLVPGDTNGVVDVFVHDRQTDVTTRLDLTVATGLAPDADAYLADVSPDGRWVAFSSSASTIVAGDANGQFDAFRYDAQTATVAIASPALFPLANGSSFAATVSDDGRYVTFQSQASNLVPGDTNGTTDVFISDMATRSTHRLSLDGAGDPRPGISASPSATADARSVVYTYQPPLGGVITIWRAELALS
jgi:Tol biopolymer transport system component